MLRTKSLIASVKDVPNTWIFEHYLNIPSLSGQEVTIKSPLSPGVDKHPSFTVYVHRSGEYKFKDFSTGYGGNGVELIVQLWKKTTGTEITGTEAMIKIIADYNQYILDNDGYSISQFKEHTKYKVTSTERRKWNTLDRKYWTEYEISSKQLESDGVYPLESYLMSKEEEGIEHSLTINGEHLYGYYRLDGTLYKIYQPKVRDKKFIKVRDYLQGMDQLKFKSDNLVITSSLKDRRCLLNLELDLESVAPDSENCMIKPDVMEALKYKFKNIVVLFDADEAGNNAAAKYWKRDNLEVVLFNMEKDVAEAVRVHGSEIVLEQLKPLLEDKLIFNDKSKELWKVKELS